MKTEQAKVTESRMVETHEEALRRERSIPRIVDKHDISDEEMLKAMSEPGNVIVSQKTPGTTGTLEARPINEHVTLRNFQSQREMLFQLKRKRESEIESVKAEMRKLNDRYEKLQREVFVIQVKEEAARAAIRTMEDRGVNE